MAMFRFVILFCVVVFLSLGQSKIDAPEKEVSVVVTQDIEAVEGKSVSLPCDVTPPNNHDKVYMVFWFQHGSGYPIYSFDVRGKSMSQAKHWSDEKVFGTRAYFRTVSEPAQLVIDDIRRHDEGVYRCRVDFRNAQTRSFRYNLTVVGKWVNEGPRPFTCFQIENDYSDQQILFEHCLNLPQC
jgi:hypothetical protein